MHGVFANQLPVFAPVVIDLPTNKRRNVNALDHQLNRCDAGLAGFACPRKQHNHRSEQQQSTASAAAVGFAASGGGGGEWWYCRCRGNVLFRGLALPRDLFFRIQCA